MDVLVPIDGSECSFRALEFAIRFAGKYGATLHVVHFSDAETEATDQILSRARELLDAADVECEPELVLDDEFEIRTAARAGERIVELVDGQGYDHVVMGHHGHGQVERALVGSAVKKVLESERIPVTVIP